MKPNFSGTGVGNPPAFSAQLILDTLQGLNLWSPIPPSPLIWPRHLQKQTAWCQVVCIVNFPVPQQKPECGLNVVRSVKQRDGFETYRHSVLTLRFANFGFDGCTNRLATFQHAAGVTTPHLVRLGEAMEETRRAASTVLDQIQQTIFLLEFIGVWIFDSCAHGRWPCRCTQQHLGPWT